MMVEFVHHKIQIINGFLSQLTEVQAMLLERSFQFEVGISKLLVEFTSYFKSIGDVSKESEIIKLSTLLLTVKKGFDPIKLEKINSGKREFYWGIAYHASDELQRIITEMLSAEMKKLDDAEEILSNMLLGLLQNQILTDGDLKKLDSITKIELFWKELVKQNTSIALLEKKMKLQITTEDIYLLIEKSKSKMNQ